jgi:hypothetical protein
MDSAAAGLIGVLLGGAITAGANFILAVRRERVEEARARERINAERLLAARLIWTELQRARASLSHVARHKSWSDVHGHIRSESWEKYGPTLASELPLESWRHLVASYLLVFDMGAAESSNPVSEVDDKTVDRLKRAIGAVQKAIDILEPLCAATDAQDIRR